MDHSDIMPDGVPAIKKARVMVAETGASGASLGTLLVTGASSGVGEHLVRHYAAKGWKVAAVARNRDKLTSLCSSTVCNGNARAYPCDVADRAQVLDMVAAVLQDMGHIDVLIPNAAQSHDSKPFWELPIEDIDRLIDVNLKGTMYVVHAVLKHMIARDVGRIIGIASVAGTWGIPNESCYVASKHGMVGFLDTIANETRKTNICVTTLCPGGIDTPWWRKDHPYGDNKQHANGTTSHLLQTQELIDIVEHQLSQPTTRVWKRVTFFPKGEWH